ncbi:MAG: hypothetical protein K5905_24080 [Roseibium sp.]|uniref:hypothetical protein n=1 Tax=Roseibium sp. TaxID=1936156 RepID=UPI0026256285|nr:hypothetical protein [Roseibium sp.]MCV0428548.1 hypothetical protein [Roseibium sp.]
MALETNCLRATEKVSFMDRWAEATRHWFREYRTKKVRKNATLDLLKQSDKVLEDIGTSRAELVRELGYDPRDLPVALRGRVDLRL